jgi:hypothetical protein
MESSPPAPESPFEKPFEWDNWRGSPDLLAHVARVALRYAAEDGQSASCVIDFEVAQDHEIFSSPNEFVASVTREALRKFTDVHISVASKPLAIDVTLRRLAPWWRRGTASDAGVILLVHGEEEASVEDAFAGMRMAIRRGVTESEPPPAYRGFFIAVFGGMAALAGLVSALILLNVFPPDLVFGGLTACAFLLGFFVVLPWVNWIYPSIEVAPSGQMNLSRFLKLVSPITATLVVGAIAKLLYGGS